MTIELTPEDEKLIQKRIESGAFQSVEDVIHDALASQEAETAWLEENKSAISEKIGRGIAQLERGEGLSGEVVRARLERRKANWLKSRGA